MNVVVLIAIYLISASISLSASDAVITMAAPPVQNHSAGPAKDLSKEQEELLKINIDDLYIPPELAGITSQFSPMNNESWYPKTIYHLHFLAPRDILKTRNLGEGRRSIQIELSVPVPEDIDYWLKHESFVTELEFDRSKLSYDDRLAPISYRITVHKNGFKLFKKNKLVKTMPSTNNNPIKSARSWPMHDKSSRNEFLRAQINSEPESIPGKAYDNNIETHKSLNLIGTVIGNTAIHFLYEYIGGDGCSSKIKNQITWDILIDVSTGEINLEIYNNTCEPIN